MTRPCSLAPSGCCWTTAARSRLASSPTRSSVSRLLRAAGFHDVTEIDITPALAATAAAWLAETEPHAEELARLEPPGAFEQRQADRRSMLAAIRDWLLRRALLLARTA
jgi:hypothetical protein